jgi:hypothetical protein
MERASLVKLIFIMEAVAARLAISINVFHVLIIHIFYKMENAMRVYQIYCMEKIKIVRLAI